MSICQMVQICAIRRLRVNVSNNYVSVTLSVLLLYTLYMHAQTLCESCNACEMLEHTCFAMQVKLNHSCCDLGLGRPGDKTTPYPLQSISSAESYSLMYSGFAKHAHAASTTVAVCTELVLP